MMFSGTRKFFMTDVPFDQQTGVPNIANLNAAGYDPTDRQRLFFHYNSKAGQIQLNPQGNMYGRANLFGGNYSFDTGADYLNSILGGGGQNPIIPGSSGLENQMGPVTGPGGAMYADNLRIPLPSTSPVPNNNYLGASCPYGFYSYNGTCVPGVNLDPTNPANILGINGIPGNYQNGKGVILQVIPPVRTQFGQLFQVVINVQNIGNQPGKFFVKTSIPSIGVGESMSNSTLLSPGQKGVIYQSMQMPSSANISSLLTLQTDLYMNNLNASADAQPLLQDSNQAQLPAPSTTYGQPPLTPPVPQFPLSPQPNPNQYGAYAPPPPYGRSFAAFPQENNKKPQQGGGGHHISSSGGGNSHQQHPPTHTGGEHQQQKIVRGHGGDHSTGFKQFDHIGPQVNHQGAAGNDHSNPHLIDSGDQHHTQIHSSTDRHDFHDNVKPHVIEAHDDDDHRVRYLDHEGHEHWRPDDDYYRHHRNEYFRRYHHRFHYYPPDYYYYWLAPSPLYLDEPIVYASPNISIYPPSPDNTYPAFSSITVMASGFVPGETVTIQMYTTSTMMGRKHYKQRIFTQTVIAGAGGAIEGIPLIIPNLRGRELMIVTHGHTTGVRRHMNIEVI